MYNIDYETELRSVPELIAYRGLIEPVGTDARMAARTYLYGSSADPDVARERAMQLDDTGSTPMVKAPPSHEPAARVPHKARPLDRSASSREGPPAAKAKTARATFDKAQKADSNAIREVDRAKKAHTKAERDAREAKAQHREVQDKADEAVVLDDTTALEDDLADMEREIRNARETLCAPASLIMTPSMRVHASRRLVDGA